MVIVGRDLEKPGVIQAGAIAGQKRGLIFQDPKLNYVKKRELWKYLHCLLVECYSVYDMI